MKKVLAIFCSLFIIVFGSANAQTISEQDTAVLRLKKMPDDTNKVMALFKKSLEESVNNLQRSEYYANETYKLASKLNFTKGVIYSCDLIGNNHLQNGNYKKAYEWLNKSIRLKEKKPNPFELAIGYNQLAVLFRQMGNFKMAKEFSHKSIEQSKILGKNRFIGLSTGTLSNIFYENKEFDSALFYNEKALQIERKEEDSSSISLSLTNQGVIYMDIKQYDKSIEKSKEALKYADPDDKRINIICYTNLASCYVAKNDLANAEISFKKVFAISEEFIETDQLILLKSIYADFLYKKGRYKEAFEYSRKFQQMKDSIGDTEMKNNIAELETKFQTEKKEKENQLLKQQSEIDQLNLLENERKNFILKLVIAGSGIILVLLTLFVTNRIKTSKKLAIQNEQINKQNTTLKTLNFQLIESEEIIQKSDAAKDKLLSVISHYISNPVKALANYTGGLISTSETLSKEEMLKALNSINSTIVPLQSMLNNLLNWSHIQKNGLRSFIQPLNLNDLLQECLFIYKNTATDKNISFGVFIPKDATIKADKEMMLIVVRNLINNAIKFSPRNSVVAISFSNNTLGICDKGIGMEQNLISKILNEENTQSNYGTENEKGIGMGLQLVAECVKAQRFTWNIKSEINKGTCFEIRVNA